MSPDVTCTGELRDIYTSSSIPSQGRRWDRLKTSFGEKYGALVPQFIARAPGRVNVIGEHIDYCGFSVLPAAIEPDLLIAVWADYGEQQDRPQRAIPVEAINLSPSYPDEQFTYTCSGQIELHGASWANYLKSAFNVTLNHLSRSSSGWRTPQAVKLLVDGTVPPSSGLSSSAALSTASALVALRVHQPDRMAIPKCLAAFLAVSAEQACGVSVGGMDQTASVFGQTSKLLHIEFNPTTRVMPLSLPCQSLVSLVIANSLVTSNKSHSSKHQYNLRVVECRLAARILSKSLLTTIKSIRTLHDLVQGSSTSTSSTHQSIKDLLEKTKDLCKDARGLTIDETLEKLDMDLKTFEDEISQGMEVEPQNGKYEIFRRARHVFAEAKRVYDFRELVERAEAGQVDPNDAVIRMGELMNQSHQSCQTDYQCSCEELDQLITIARSNGSLGSRLTGAGWGGASVHLVRDEDASRVMEALKNQYYRLRFPNLSDDELNQACFATKPQGGACIFTL